FDASGNALSGSVQTSAGTTTGTFSVSGGEQIVYLRVRAPDDFPPDPQTKLHVTVNLQPLAVTPPATQFSGAETLFSTHPQGDGTVPDALASKGASKADAFEAAAGPLTVQVMPFAVPPNPNLPPPPPQTLTWAVYADGQLIAWNQTGADPST